MRQRRFGKKVQNWHRPLGHDAFRRRFLRKRNEDSEADEERGQYLRGVLEADPPWDIFRPYYCCYCGKADCSDVIEFTDEDASAFAIQQLLSELCATRTPLIGEDWDKFVDTQGDLTGGALAGKPSERESIEERLLSHSRILLGYGAFGDVEAAIRASTGDQRDRQAINRFLNKSKGIGLAKRLYLFSPFWIRNPRTWDRESFESLLNHLFVLYPVPPFLFRIWHSTWSKTEHHYVCLKWVCWFILLAQGGSLKRAARLFGWRIPSGFLRHLFGVPRDSELLEANVRAWVLSQGGSLVDVQRILTSQAFVVDPTDASGDPTYSAFWESTVRWLIAHREQMSEMEANSVLSWAMHEFTEANGTQRRFSWKGRSVCATVARSLEYRREMVDSFYGRDYRWDPHDLDWEYCIEGESWSFSELISGPDLFEEGLAMDHCVGTYAARCVAECSAIVSVRHNGIRRLTVEVHPRSCQIVQVRGVQNRMPYADENSAVAAWIKAIRARM